MYKFDNRRYAPTRVVRAIMRGLRFRVDRERNAYLNEVVFARINPNAKILRINPAYKGLARVFQEAGFSVQWLEEKC